MSDTKPKILIVARNASSRFGGEAFLPLKYFQILRQRGYPVKLIAHERNRDDLAALLPHALGDMAFVRDSIWHRLIWRAGSVFPHRIREAVFDNLIGMVDDIYQARHIRVFLRRGEVEVIHQPIPVSPRAPSRIHGFGVPVVIGPMNGGMHFPHGYEDYESRRLQYMVALGRGMAVFINRLIPGKRRAAALLVANPRTRAALPVPNHPRIIEMVENGVDLSVWAGRRNHAPEPALPGQIRLVFMGRLIAWKGIDITLDALAAAHAAGIEASLEIVGDGSEREKLERMVRDKGLEKAVIFHGFRSQDECAEILRAADALILNSLWECGGAVVLEAMSVGRPVIASDWGGPADYVDSTCGILVHPVPRADFAQRLAEAIIHLANDPEKCRRMGKAGAEKVIREFDWEKKVDRMITIYAQALEVSGSQKSDLRPNLAEPGT